MYPLKFSAGYMVKTPLMVTKYIQMMKSNYEYERGRLTMKKIHQFNGPHIDKVSNI